MARGFCKELWGRRRGSVLHSQFDIAALYWILCIIFLIFIVVVHTSYHVKCSYLLDFFIVNCCLDFLLHSSQNSISNTIIGLTYTFFYLSVRINWSQGRHAQRHQAKGCASSTVSGAICILLARLLTCWGLCFKCQSMGRGTETLLPSVLMTWLCP